MKEIALSYGQGTITLQVPEKNFGGLYGPPPLPKAKGFKLVKEALDNPIGEKLENLSKDKKVAVIVEDGTRDAPAWTLRAVIQRLLDAKEVIFILATGMHKAVTDGNKKIEDIIKMAAEGKIKQYSILAHDTQKATFVSCGRTSFGNEVEVNAVANDCEIFVTVSDMKPHYFAGYSNPIKNFVPGICSFKTIEKNHSLAVAPEATFVNHPWHPVHKNNPVAQDMIEAMNLILSGRPVFTLNFYSAKGRVYYAVAGEIRAATEKCIVEIDKIAGIKAESSRYVVVSPGGYPFDETLYNAQRALELTQNAVLDGGEVLFLSKNTLGIAETEKANKEFFEPLTLKTLEQIIIDIENDFHVPAQKAYKVAKYFQRIGKLYLYTDYADKELLAKGRFLTADNPQAIIDEWIRQDPDAKILFFEGGAKIFVLPN